MRAERHRGDSPPRREALASCSVSPPSGPTTTVTGTPPSAAGAASPGAIGQPARASAGCARGSRRARRGSSTCAGPRRAALLHRLERLAPKLRQVARRGPGRHARGPLGLERDDLGDAELGGLLHQPGEPLAVARPDRERQLRGGASRRSAESTSTSHAFPHRQRAVRCPPAPRRPGARPLSPARTRRTRRWWASPSATRPARPSGAVPLGSRTRITPPGGDRPPAGVAPLVLDGTSPPSASARPEQRAPPPASIPEKIAIPPGRSARDDRGQQRDVHRAEDVGEHQVGRAEQRRQIARVAVEELDLVARPRSARRSAPATGFASASISMPTARRAPSLTAAIARMPLPLPRSSTRSPGRIEPLEQRERRAGGAVLAAAERRLGIEDDRRAVAVARSGEPGRRHA